MTSLTENVPNEPGSWDEDWSFAYLEKLYAALHARFRLARLGEAEEVIADASRMSAFVRHDVDVSLRIAGELARREAGWSVKSTYHVMIDSPFYDLRSDESAALLNDMQALGHEVGLHYDIVARGMRDADRATREDDIARACTTLERIMGAPVRSVSFHLPVQDLLRGPLRVAGRVSGYAEDLFRWYVSDSRARWREGEPIASLDRPRSHVLQILVHPVWWGDESVRPELRLRSIVQGLAAERKVPYGPLRDRMSDHILYRAADPSP
ncbi:MAG: hypothetical protein JWP87_1328 [Labilithrix sp.]|nr:hypothetical protein [Labilithrix sp.]